MAADHQGLKLRIPLAKGVRSRAGGLRSRNFARLLFLGGSTVDLNTIRSSYRRAADSLRRAQDRHTYPDEGNAPYVRGQLERVQREIEFLLASIWEPPEDDAA